MKMFDNVTKKLSDSRKVVFVTGAGISQESGIPTFRGKDGHWRKHDPMKLATIDAFYDDPKLVWEWYEERRKNILAAKPNEGHSAISKMEKFKDVVVLTQNIDGLHQRSGSTNVLELHGSIIRIKCTACNSTGRPCVSQPALKTTFFPSSILNLYHRSLNTRPLRWPACGSPFSVGGPSMNMIFSCLFGDSLISSCKSSFER